MIFKKIHFQFCIILLTSLTGGAIWGEPKTEEEKIKAQRAGDFLKEKRSGTVKPYVPVAGQIIRGFAGKVPPPMSRGMLPPGKYPRIYVVQPGDTLSSVCERVLDDRDYWPKLWALNPHVTNPHWIYPGTEIRFYPDTSTGIPYLEIIPEKDILPESLARLRSDSLFDVNVDDLEISEDDALNILSVEDLPEEAGDLFAYAGRKFSREDMRFLISGFIAEDALKVAGHVARGLTEASTYGEGDEILVSMETGTEGLDSHVGSRFLIVQATGQEVQTNESTFAGNVVRYKGIVDIQGREKAFLKGYISSSFAEIEEGDLLIAYAPVPDRLDVDPRENGPDVKGRVIRFLSENKSIGAENDLLFVDLGTSNGIAQGNVFSIFTYPVNDNIETDVAKKVGIIKIAEASQHFSSAVVLRSFSEIPIGGYVRHDENSESVASGDGNEGGGEEDDDEEDDDEEDDDEEDDDEEDDDEEDDDEEDDDEEDDDEEDDEEEDDEE